MADCSSSLSLDRVLEAAFTEVYALVFTSVVGSVPVASTTSYSLQRPSLLRKYCAEENKGEDKVRPKQ